MASRHSRAVILGPEGETEKEGERGEGRRGERGRREGGEREKKRERGQDKKV